MTAVRNQADPTEERPEPKPGVFGPWSQTDMLLALVCDRLATLIWQKSADPQNPTPPPKPLPRPGIESNVVAISQEALAFLEYKRAHRGADPPEGWTPQLA